VTEKVGAVLVVGGGIAGIQASLDLADSGFKVYLLDESPSIGGVVLTPFASWLTKKMPKRTLGVAIGLWLTVLNVYGLVNVFG
jgi:heterodisulfide reductase subunit A-like polyferredoxin